MGKNTESARSRLAREATDPSLVISGHDCSGPQFAALHAEVARMRKDVELLARTLATALRR